MLLPLPKPRLLRFNLLRELLPQRFFLLLEFRVIPVPRLGLAEFARLHLLLAVMLVVEFFGGGDEVEHVRADEEGAELFMVAVVLILDCRKYSVRGDGNERRRERTFGDTPDVLAAFDDAAVRGTNIFCGTDDGERDGVEEHVSVLCVLFVVQRRRVDADALGIDDFPHL